MRDLTYRTCTKVPRFLGLNVQPSIYCGLNVLRKLTSMSTDLKKPDYSSRAHYPVTRHLRNPRRPHRLLPSTKITSAISLTAVAQRGGAV
jgi:hypothetical protein